MRPTFLRVSNDSETHVFGGPHVSNGFENFWEPINDLVGEGQKYTLPSKITDFRPNFTFFSEKSSLQAWLWRRSDAPDFLTRF